MSHERFRRGQWLRFELGDPKSIPVLIVGGGKVEVGKIEDPAEIAALLAKVRTTKCGRLCGISVPGGKLLVPGGKDAEGKETPEKRLPIPDCVAPQRAVLGPDGSQNIVWLHGSEPHNLLIPLEGLRNVEAVLLREDLPEHRNATCNPEWNPKR